MINKPGPPSPTNFNENQLSEFVKTPPKHFSTKQKSIWKGLIPVLAETPAKNVDRLLIEQLVTSIALERDYLASLEQHGLLIPAKGGPKRNPAQTGLRDVQQAILRICRELGMSPRARATVRTLADSDVEDDPVLNHVNTTPEKPWEQV